MDSIERRLLVQLSAASDRLIALLQYRVEGWSFSKQDIVIRSTMEVIDTLRSVLELQPILNTRELTMCEWKRFPVISENEFLKMI